ncbi:lipocalin family protein [Marixanthomonas spongiae]|nr:lipocalin family protein [Marixanthomonas spongiae]
MKITPFKQALLALILFATATAFGQTVNAETLIGTWELKGTLMGNDGSGWVLPHKHSAPDCGKDHTQFSINNQGKELTYHQNCDVNEKPFQWHLEGNTLTLSRGEKTVLWHILSLENGRLKVGVQTHPDATNKMYVMYIKRS